MVLTKYVGERVERPGKRSAEGKWVQGDMPHREASRGCLLHSVIVMDPLSISLLARKIGGSHVSPWLLAQDHVLHCKVSPALWVAEMEDIKFKPKLGSLARPCLEMKI